ncbi:MAG: sulfurtransferase [Pirellulales bacterium]
MSFVLLSGVLMGLIQTGQAAGDDAYPRAELLVEPADLARAEVAKQFVILDARPRRQYDEGHVPGAVLVDASAWAKAFGDGQDSEGWSRRIGEAGIDRQSKVVVYDNSSNKDAARIWWILGHWGADDARLLNGGWAGWQSGNLPVETEASRPKQAEFQARARAKRLATKDLLLDSLSGASGKLQVVDARSEGEFCGTEKLNNKRAGAIPGATHLEWSDLVDPETQRFKGPDQLRELFDSAGIDLEQPAVAHCQSGGRASVMAFGLELMGARDVRNYYASWSEWGNADDTPIEPGKPADEK